MFDAASPKNGQVLRYVGSAQSCPPGDTADPYRTLGTHPDLVMRLWDELPAGLPVRCAWVVGHRPVLLRPDTGVVFGLAAGTSFYALRLPPADRAALEDAKRRLVHRRADGFGLQGKDRRRYLAAQLEPCPVGADWCSGMWLAEELDLCRRAYDWAG